MRKYVHICKMCGKEFENNNKNSQFCSRQCYLTYRKENGKLKEKLCPICKKTFMPDYPNQIFCSIECRVKSTENKISCICEYCGKQFDRIKSEVEKK